MRKQQRGLSAFSVKAALHNLCQSMKDDAPQTQPARLSIWSYEPSTSNQLEALWSAFGRSAWIEFIPTDLSDKVRPTRIYVEARIKAILPLLHEISAAVYGSRGTSPLPLPLGNFNSTAAENLKNFWYHGLDKCELKKQIERLAAIHRQSRINGQSSYRDERHLIFSPARNNECHGKAHPTGSGDLSFVGGRFRFGAALYAGFHYDVKSAKAATLQSVLLDSEGKNRDMKPERRTYINIFPNDYLLPAK